MNFNWVPDTKAVIAILVILCTIFLAGALMLHPVTTDNPNALAMLNIVVGGWVAYGTTVIQYYFGSSQGSKAKDDVISQIATGNSPPLPPTSATQKTSVTEVTSSTADPAAEKKDK